MTGLRYGAAVVALAAVAGLLALIGVAWGVEPATRAVIHAAHGRATGPVLSVATVRMLAYSCAIVTFIGCVVEGIEVSHRYR